MNCSISVIRRFPFLLSFVQSIDGAELTGPTPFLPAHTGEETIQPMHCYLHWRICISVAYYAIIKPFYCQQEGEEYERKTGQLCWLPVSARLCAELIHGVAEAADDVMQTNLRGRVVMVELGIGCDTLLKAGYSISHQLTNILGFRILQILPILS